MRIIVCVKHVPDVQSERRFEDGRLLRGEDDVLNELDENAIEAAVSLVEDNGGEVIALTMGPADAEDALMRALQMGADRGLLISDDRLEGADALGTAKVLAAAIKQLDSEEKVDMVITGMASLDAVTSMMPAALAAELKMPFLGLAHELSVDGGVVSIARSADGFDDELSCLTPVVVSVTDQVNEPRYPAFAAMKAARSKPMDDVSLDDLADYLDVDFVQQAIASTTVIDTSERQRAAGTIIMDSGDAGVKLAQYLMEKVK